MFDKDTINKIKACTVAVGVAEIGAEKPFILVGTGFLVSSKGYVMTAGHVSDKCLDSIENWKPTKKLKRAIFFPRREADGKFHFYGAEVGDRVFRPDMKTKPKGYAMPESIDIAVFDIGNKVPLPQLEIKDPEQIELYEDIAICSYPNGLQSMNWDESAYIGRRLSPLIQFGKIASFFPMDDAPIPNGIQTDIIATGGTSGAAIVDANAKVVGITLQVIKGAILDGNTARFTSNTGLAYGLSTNMIKRFTDNLDAFFIDRRDDLHIPIDMTVFGDFKVQFL